MRTLSVHPAQALVEVLQSTPAPRHLAAYAVAERILQFVHALQAASDSPVQQRDGAIDPPFV